MKAVVTMTPTEATQMCASTLRESSGLTDIEVKIVDPTRSYHKIGAICKVRDYLRGRNLPFDLAAAKALVESMAADFGC